MTQKSKPSFDFSNRKTRVHTKPRFNLFVIPASVCDEKLSVQKKLNFKYSIRHIKN